MSVPDQKPSRGVPALDGGHPGHPTARALTGFFVGMALMLAIPATFAAVITQVASAGSLLSLAPLGLLPFAVPVVLCVLPRTRLFGAYMLLGMVSTAVVVAGVSAAVLLVLVRTS
ncbi:MAG: hypothetical protein LH468_05620 [Nocardioides sp.]|nr:hypothetical protein [Nocardioides sp.]